MGHRADNLANDYVRERAGVVLTPRSTPTPASEEVGRAAAIEKPDGPDQSQLQLTHPPNTVRRSALGVADERRVDNQ